MFAYKQKYFLFSIILYSFFKINAQDYSTNAALWPDLIRMDLSKNLTIFYDPKITKVINMSIGNETEDIAAFIIKGNRFTIKYSSSPAHSRLDQLYIENQEGENFLMGKGSKCLCITNNGNIYAYVPLERNGFRKVLFLEKYIVKGAQIVEIKQPLIYIGKSCNANTDIELLAERITDSSRIDYIVNGTEIFVLGFLEDSITNEYWYLIKSKIGLIGWHKSIYIGNKVTYSTFSISLLDCDMP